MRPFLFAVAATVCVIVVFPEMEWWRRGALAAAMCCYTVYMRP